LKNVDIKPQPAYSCLSDEEIARSRHVAALMEIGWSVVHQSLVVRERFAAKQFADVAFDLDADLAYQLACFAAGSRGPSASCPKSSPARAVATGLALRWTECPHHLDDDVLCPR
jgi:hypothetical protein